MHSTQEKYLAYNSWIASDISCDLHICTVLLKYHAKNTEIFMHFMLLSWNLLYDITMKSV